MNGFNLVNNKCWRLFITPSNHTAAERTCTSYGGTLFMAKNSIDNRALASYVSRIKVDRIWMGAFCIGNDKNQCYWDDQQGSLVSYDNFAAGFPNAGIGRCVYYSVPGSPSGQWLNRDCAEELPFVCELPPTHSDVCDLNFNDNCYFRFEEMSFSAAQFQCQQLCGELLSIHSSEENRYIASIYSQFSYDAIRIGGMAAAEDFVVWTDGSVMDYLNLETFDSSGSCLWMSLNTTKQYSRGAWFTGDCHKPKRFVCKRPIGTPDCSRTPPPATIAPPPVTSPTCTSGVYMAPGTISSPGYPNPYNSGCTYTLATFGANRIRITFDYFNTLPNVDRVYIYDGGSSDAPLIVGMGGGYLGRPTFTSTGNVMFIKFEFNAASNKGNYIGFIANFYSVF